MLLFTGQFSQMFTIPDDYYIWSGYVDLHGLKNYYMTVEVTPAQSRLDDVKTRINGVEALIVDMGTVSFIICFVSKSIEIIYIKFI